MDRIEIIRHTHSAHTILISEELLRQSFDTKCLFVGQRIKFLFSRPLWQMSVSLSQEAAKQFDFSIWHLDSLFYRLPNGKN